MPAGCKGLDVMLMEGIDSIAVGLVSGLRMRFFPVAAVEEEDERSVRWVLIHRRREVEAEESKVHWYAAEDSGKEVYEKIELALG
jgi:hypothetical protein